MLQALKKHNLIAEGDIILVEQPLGHFMDAGHDHFMPKAVSGRPQPQMTQQSSYSERIRLKLTDGLKPSLLEITDDTMRHVGHAGHDGRGETHFHVKIVSEVFIGLNRLDRQRLVYTLLSDEMREWVHALTMEVFAPAEHNPKNP